MKIIILLLFILFFLQGCVKIDHVDLWTGVDIAPHETGKPPNYSVTAKTRFSRS